MNRQQAEALNLRIVIGLSIVMWLLDDVQMWLFHAHRLSDELNQSGAWDHDKGFLFWLVLVLLATPLLMGWLQSIGLENRFKELSGDWYVINKAKKEVFGNLAWTYLIISLCFAVMR
jgi:hypothetical protein